MKIAIIDAQGAGLGKSIIKKIRKEIGENIHITALGTNDTATSNMVKAGANNGITGEKNICFFCRNEEISALIGPIGTICSGGINGEITPSISHAIFQMECTKYILPLKVHGIYIPGTRNLEIKELVTEIVTNLKQSITNKMDK